VGAAAGDLIARRAHAEDTVMKTRAAGPCVLYAFRCAAYAARTARPRPALLKWWNWKNRAL
jgi:hypothetical protein